MATIGQCKACGRIVSDEAATCPTCGQPKPCVLPPAVGSVHNGHVTSINGASYDGHFVTVRLPSGVRGSLYLRNDVNVGDAIRVRVAKVDSGRDNAIAFSLEK